MTTRRFVIRLTPRERFERNVDRSGGNAPDVCWPWTGATRGGDAKGQYGGFVYDGKPKYAHRLAYEFAFGPIPAGRVIDHTCRNRLCCRPEHLDPVSPAVNSARVHYRPRAASPTQVSLFDAEQYDDLPDW